MKILNWSFFESQSAPGSHSRFRALQTLRWSLLLIGAVLILSGQLSAAPPAPDNKADLFLFDFGDAKDKQIREAAIARFNKRYPNVKVVGLNWEEPDPFYYRKVLLKIYWDDQEHPSVLTPLGDFFCIGHSIPGNFAALPITVSAKPKERHRFGGSAALNCYFPMPFQKKMRIAFENQRRLFSAMLGGCRTMLS